MIQVSKPSLGNEELDLVKKVFESAWLGSGKNVIEFENSVANFLGGKVKVVAVNTGTSALHLALEACGVGPGDEVIVPSLTFCASIQVILMCGAKPVFCEVSPETLCIDPIHIEKLITSKTKAVMPVHYAGIPSEMDRILDIGRKNSIIIVEDAAHAFGTSFNGQKIGSFGDITCFSFDPIKNITCGEGGAVVINDIQRSSIITRRRNLGISQESWLSLQSGVNQSHQVTDKGYRYHMSNINAAIGLAQF
jgi:perosamine synthetase